MGNRVCGHKELEDEDPDTAWQKQNKAQSEKSMYKIINLQNGGTLLETFKEMRERNDLESFKEIAAKELPPYLYNGGEDTHLITKTEYVMYLKMCAKQVATIWTDEKAKQLGEEFDKRQEGQFRNKFQEHEACFDLDNRGGVGETILHLCYLNNSDIHKELAKVLIEKYPKMVLDIYEGYEYYGESCLHLAIVNQDLESVKFLVEKGARLDQRASGRFFLPEAHKDGSAKGKDIDYFGYAYYGEYPLHFAASVANEDIYTYLLEKSNPLTGLVDPNAQDSFGNTALHMLVIHNKPEMYKLVLERADPEIRNVSGLTPLGLACKLGRNKLFQQILEVNSTTFWKFSNFHCVAYPLDNIDSIKSNGDHDWDSALSIIVGSNKDEHLPMLDGGVIHLLLLEKWRVFAKRQFTIRLTFAIIYLLTLSVAIYTRPAGDLIGGTDVKSIVRYVAEALTTIGCLIYLGLEFFHIKTVKLGYFSTMRNVPAKGLFLFSCVLILLCVPMRFLDKRYIEDMLVIAAVPLAWTYILFFYRVLESLGPFVTMIYKMIAGDLFRFSLITITILSSFSPAFYFLFKDIGVYVFTFDTVYGTWMSLFHMAFGEFATLISGKVRALQLAQI
uniref:Transient receptor potential cation channel subfamily V member 6-like n=1 Tax=Saccoglossus kowalevskii TaxID=10224 RepID=A0ABM0MLT0_SACKO|nr:PREDICTED: transient receptor potential cation channel subfamily V member 6-like [Saccoglossus kowalevskii]